MKSIAYAGREVAAHAAQVVAGIELGVENAFGIASAQVDARIRPQKDAVHELMKQVAVCAEEGCIDIVGLLREIQIELRKGGGEIGERGSIELCCLRQKRSCWRRYCAVHRCNSSFLRLCAAPHLNKKQYLCEMV